MSNVSAPDAYRTLSAPATGGLKDRGSQFLAFAYPVSDEATALSHIAALRKEHFKANHHCFAWRLGPDGQQFRTNDDGEPSGTAGRPILGQIDAVALTDVCVVVVRYFGGTLLGTSGLIQAYRGAAAAALGNAQIKEIILTTPIQFTVDYAVHPDLVQALHRLGIGVESEDFGAETATLTLALRRGQVDDLLLQLRALLWKTTPAEARTLDWPKGIVILKS